jgi:ABC-2 type transport system ATP-binding protein
VSLVLEIRDLRHRLGDLVALDGVTLAVDEGELVGLPIGEDERLRFGYMPEERGLDAQMRIGDQVA